LLEKLKRSAEVRNDTRDSLSVEYKLLLETSNLKCRGVVNDINLQMATQKLKICGIEDRLLTAKTAIISLRDKAKKYNDISAKGDTSLIAMNAFNEKAEVRQNERSDKRSQVKNILGMMEGGSRGSKRRYTGRDGTSFDRDDSASNATRRSTISNSFMNRMSWNGIGAGGDILVVEVVEVTKV